MDGWMDGWMDGCAMCEGEHKSCNFTAIKMILRKLS